MTYSLASDQEDRGMDHYVGKEHRTWGRHPCDLRALLYALTLGERASWPVQIWNLSRTGCKIISPRRLEPRSLIELHITLPAAREPYLAAARVVYTLGAADGRFEMGCQLARMLNDDELTLLLQA
jgi:hypothetical protein